MAAPVEGRVASSDKLNALYRVDGDRVAVPRHLQPAAVAGNVQDVVAAPHLE